MSFRGPARGTDAPFCVALGGSATFGTFVEAPFPVGLTRLLGRPVINLGCRNAGLDALVGDAAVMDICARARVTVVQVLGAQHLSNAYYAVHPRRNDRFLYALPPLLKLFPEVDFARFHFVGHMLGALRLVSAERFAEVLVDMQRHWLVQMQALTQHMPRRTVLLWLAGCQPPTNGAEPGPLFLDRRMIDEVRPWFDSYVELLLPERAQGAMPKASTCAAALPNAAAHDLIARELAPVIDRLVAS